MKAVRSGPRKRSVLSDGRASEVSLGVHVRRQKDKMLGALVLDEQGGLHARHRDGQTNLWDISQVSGGLVTIWG